MPGDAAGGAVVGPVERRAGQRIDQRKSRDAGDGKAASDLGIRIGIGVVFDQQVDLSGDSGLGVRNRPGAVAGIVKIEHVDRQGSGRQLETTSQLGTGEAEPLQRYAGGLIEIGESNTEASRLGGLCWAEAAGEQPGEDGPSPHRCRNPSATESPRY